MLKKELSIFFVCAFLVLSIMSCKGPVESIDETTGEENTGITTGSKFIVADTVAENCKNHDDAEDYTWDNSIAIQIALNGQSISSSSPGVSVSGSTATITSAGTYILSGTLTDGRIIVNTSDEEIVRLILNGVDIGCSYSSPFLIESAEKTMIVLADNTKNYITDAKKYIFEDADTDEPNAAVFCKSDLTIYGNGTLTVQANYNDGISSKDGLIIDSGILIINSVDDGMRGKDYLIVKNGSITVNSKGDGLKSDNEDDSTKGYIYIQNGSINVSAAGDAITGQTDVLITNGSLNLTSGGGSNYKITDDSSAKGIKGLVYTIIDGGTITLSSADDAIHSNINTIINGGNFTISSGDDGIHADTSLTINGGIISITKSYEGIESRKVITINDGNIYIISSDDGLNVAGGVDGSGWPGSPGRIPSSGNFILNVNGGYIYIEAVGDGIDINGSVVMSGGDVIVNGPTSNGNGALDYDSSFKISGGFLLAAGSSGMAQAPGTSSSQYSVLINFSSTQQAGKLFHLQNSEGSTVFSFAPKKNYQSIVFSSPELKNGVTYEVYLGGSSAGTVKDGLYQDGTYTAGTEYTSFTISGIVTKIYK